jgi:5'-methylthioadenosine phosphorylase
VLAIIGGSGLTKLANLEIGRRKVARTPYGDPSGPVTFGRIGRSEVLFLARHGYGHTIAPHEVNYRANLWALKQAGADEVVSVASVGGIRNDIWPGTLLLPHQIIDYTWGRSGTFFEGPGAPVNHIDFTEPYSRAMRERLLKATAAAGERIMAGGVTPRRRGRGSRPPPRSIG